MCVGGMLVGVMGGGCLVGKQPVEELGYHRIRLCYVLVQIADSSWHLTRNFLQLYISDNWQKSVKCNHCIFAVCLCAAR
jgi:hypothetical protein